MGLFDLFRSDPDKPSQKSTDILRLINALNAKDGDEWVGVRSRLSSLLFVMDKTVGESDRWSWGEAIVSEAGPYSQEFVDEIESLVYHDYLRCKTEYTFGGKERNYYQLTTRGKAALESDSTSPLFTDEGVEALTEANETANASGTISLNFDLLDEYPEYNPRVKIS